MTTVILPTYNEKENIGRIIKKIKRMTRNEIIVVDDASPDGTAKEAGRYKVKVIKRKERGLASAIIRGMEDAKGDKIIVMDADGSHNPKYIPKILNELDSYDMVICSRNKIENWTLKRKIISKTAEIISNITLKHKLKDPMSGYFGIKKEIYTKIKDKLNPRGYKIMLEIYMKAKPKTKEIPINFTNRRKGKSKLNKKVMIDYLKMIKELRFQ